MLKLHRHSFTDAKMDFPHSVRGSLQHKFAFAPVVSEEDEILNGIDEAREATWELGEQPEEQLEAFWDNVVADVRQDPEWNNFANDD